MDFQDRQGNSDDSQEQKLSKDDILRGKYIERNFEKILKILKEPQKPTGRDYVIIGLLFVIVLLLLFRPMGSPAGKATSIEQEEVSKKLEILTNKIDRLEKQILVTTGAVDMTTENIEQIAPSQSPEDEETKEEPPPQSKEKLSLTKPVKVAKMAPPESGPVNVSKTYKVKSGDTLWVICARFYKSKDPAVIEALGKYNNLKGPDFDLYPGNTIKIPSKEDLHKTMEMIKEKKKAQAREKSKKKKLK